MDFPGDFSHFQCSFSGNDYDPVTITYYYIAGVNKNASTIYREVIRFSYKPSRSDSAGTVPIHAIDRNFFDLNNLISIPGTAICNRCYYTFFRPAKAVIGAYKTTFRNSSCIDDSHITRLCYVDPAVTCSLVLVRFEFLESCKVRKRVLSDSNIGRHMANGDGESHESMRKIFRVPP